MQAVPNKRLFSQGSAGAIIACIALILMVAAFLPHLFSFSRYTNTVYQPMLGSTIILFIGCLIQGAGFEGFHKNYGSSMGKVASIFSIISPLALIVATGIGLAPMSTGRGYYYSFSRYSQPTNIFVFWGGLVLFGIMVILWGAACVRARKFTSTPDLFLTTGVIYILAGSFIISYFLATVGFILMFISGIIITVGFSEYSVVDMVFSYILSRAGAINKSRCAEELGVKIEDVDGAIDRLVAQGKLVVD